MLRKFLVKQKQSQQINANKYEKIEKARFYLDQEAQELEEMLVLFSAAKDEVDEFLQKKRNINSFKASGVTKFLQNLLRDTRTQTVNMNFELEIGEFLGKSRFSFEFSLLLLRKQGARSQGIGGQRR